MSHLFISHSTRDGGEIARELTRALEAAGHRCWIAPRDLKPGIPYPGQIVGAIRDCAGLVLVVTPAVNESSDVLQEVQLAGQQRKALAPIIVDRTAASDDLHYYISVRHQIAWTDARATSAELLRAFPQTRLPNSAPPAVPALPSTARQLLGGEDRAHELLRALSLKIISGGPGNRYPRGVPGPTDGYRYWATYLKADRVILFGAQKISGDLDPLTLARCRSAGFEVRRSGRELFVELDENVDADTMEQARHVLVELQHLLRP